MFINSPIWIDKEILAYSKVEDVPESIYNKINSSLQKQIEPEVSVVIPAYNEELNLIRTLASLANNVTTFPFEIIVVNNNSNDKTQEVLDKLQVRSVLQPVRGCGPARQLGQEIAKGKYILMGDADCFYPPGWIERMATEIRKPGVACVYGGYSFLTNSYYRSIGLWMYEKLRNILVVIRHFKRPYLNTLGMSMAYPKNLGLQVGFIDSDIRGEDGRMCFDLMQFGKVIRLRDRSCNVWTGTRTLEKEGSLLKAFLNRLFFEVTRLGQYLTPMKPHNTKTSKNRR